MGIWNIVNQPRRVLLGMKEREIGAVNMAAEEVKAAAFNRQNGYGPEPDLSLFEKLCDAIALGLMVRAVRRDRIESEGLGYPPGRPKPADRRRGRNMSRARGAEN